MTNISKTVLVCIGMMVASISVYAQNQIFDKITLRDSTIIEAKIKTVTEHLIYYQLISQDSGQTLEIEKNLVAKIIYGSGEIEIISFKNKDPLPKKPIIIYTEKPWLQKDFLNYVSLYDRDILLNANDYYSNKIRNQKILASISGGIGGGMGIAGIILIAVANNGNHNNYMFEGLDYIVGGGTLLISGTMLGIIGTTVNLRRIKKNQKGLQLVQQELHSRDFGRTQLKLQPLFNPSNNSFGFRLTYQF